MITFKNKRIISKIFFISIILSLFSVFHSVFDSPPKNEKARHYPKAEVFLYPTWIKRIFDQK